MTSAALQYEQKRLVLERWTPRRLPALLWWLDFSSAGVLYQDAAMTQPAQADLDPIGAARDRSGWGRHATAAGAARPTLRLGVQAGRAVGRWDGIDDYLSTGLPALASFYLAMVVNIADLTAHRALLGGSSAVTILRQLAPGTGMDARDDNSNYVTWPVTLQGPGAHILEFMIEAGQVTRLVDGVTLEAPAAWPPGPFTPAQLGARGGVDSLLGDIGEVVLTDGVPHSAVRRLLREYLRGRWQTP